MNFEIEKSGNIALFSLFVKWYDTSMGHNGTNKDIKKGTEGGFDERRCRRGRQAHQSLKAYWILEYLINYATEEEPITAGTIRYELEEKGINADVKSIYRAIREINIINYMLENDEADIFDAEDVIAEDFNGTEKLVVYDKVKKGYYVSQHRYDAFDILLIFEAIYSARSLTVGQADRLADIVGSFIGRKQSQKLKYKAISLERRRTTNKRLFKILFDINSALPDLTDGIPADASVLELRIERPRIDESNHLSTYWYKRTVIPYYIVLDDGKYVLICADQDDEKIYHFKIEHISKVKILEEKVTVDTSVEQYLPNYFYNKKIVSASLKKPYLLICPQALIYDLIDKFGEKNLKFKFLDIKTVLVSVDYQLLEETFYNWMFERRRYKYFLFADPEQKTKFNDFIDSMKQK